MVPGTARAVASDPTLKVATMTARIIPDFTAHDVDVDGRTVHAAIAGTGPPILLLHGFPQTHLAWSEVGPRLADRHSVICADLPGYGASESPGPEVADFAKRATAATLVRMMSELGHDRFAVVGHDRGALVALRMALDHPQRITRLGVLDVIPTSDNWAALSGISGIFAFHLFLLAQPSDLPERMIGADPDLFFGHFFDTWLKVSGAIPEDRRRSYLAACARPETIHAICQDYRASAFVDSDHDLEDRRRGTRLAMPTLALWQDPGEVELPFDPAATWAEWVLDLRTNAVPSGHFLPEECPVEVATAILELVSQT